MKAIELLLVVSIGTNFVRSSEPREEQGRLIKTSEFEEPKWMSQREIWALIRSRQTFIDITDHLALKFKKPTFTRDQFTRCN